MEIQLAHQVILLTNNLVLGQGVYDNTIAVDPTNLNTVWVGGVDLLKSTDGGVNFAWASLWFNQDSNWIHPDKHLIRFSPTYSADNTIYFLTDGGTISLMFYIQDFTVQTIHKIP